MILSLDIESIDHLWLLLRYNENDKLPISKHLSPKIKTIIYQTNRFDQEELFEFKLLLYGACIGIRKQAENWQKFPETSVIPNKQADLVNEIMQTKSYVLNLDTNFFYGGQSKKV